ncbi:hypothetical protein [Streptomyces sp. NPDC056304]|uniref:hypothetical protein n=1 Tax=Streptomyces sp. NPDC056304 TaxID=3345778 RepID=UPI0035DAF21B
MNRIPARAAPPLAPGTEPVPGYEVLAHLARTARLALYDAWSEERDCRCVVKLLRPDHRHDEQLCDRLLREGHWLRTFTHPHLVRAYETFASPEPLVVLETLTGETLSHLVGRLSRGPAAEDVANRLHRSDPAEASRVISPRPSTAASGSTRLPGPRSPISPPPSTRLCRGSGNTSVLTDRSKGRVLGRRADHFRPLLLLACSCV